MTRISRLSLTILVPVAGLFLLGGMAAQNPALALINESPSLPRGLYLRAPAASADRGAIVAIRQPAAVRPYLAHQGMPASVRLIKRVAATGGDRVCSDGRALIAPFRSVRIRAHDSSGRPLPAWRGCRQLAQGERLLLGDTADSLDSRYFGPVRIADIEGVYREAATW